MVEADLQQVLELVVQQDYGQYYVITELDSDVEDQLDRASENAGIGQEEPGRSLLILTPHQNNFELALRVERWSTEPPDDLDSWEEASEAWIEVLPGDKLQFGSATTNFYPLDVPPGRYRIRIAGQGFVRWGWPGTTTPGDRWRLQLWPSEQIIPARKLRTWPGWKP
jgi:hypothetical protein